MTSQLHFRLCFILLATLTALSISPANYATASDTKNMLTIRWEKPAALPNGSTLHITLYDAMLMDTDSTYATKTVAIDKLPFTTPLPKPITTPKIVGPAVGVRITSQDGDLLYINDVVHFLQKDKTTTVALKRIR